MDSGIDSMHNEMANGVVIPISATCAQEERKVIKNRNAERYIKKWKGFPPSLDPLKDRVGHGTHCVSVIHRIAPYASLYIARIFNDEGEISEYDEVVKVTLLAVVLYLHIGFPMGNR